MSKWLREPLIHFLLLGGLIFVVYHSVAGKGSDADEIFISKGQQENLLNTFSRTWRRPPTPDEFQGLLQDYIRQEIAYRESRKMGLDQDDIVIRRRLRQKLEMLVEDVAALMPPGDEQLQAYLDEHQVEYMLQPQISLRQVYFSTDRRGETAAQDAEAFLQTVPVAGEEDSHEEYGDPLPLPQTIRNMREDEIARLFGNVFTDGLQGLETGHWSGPVESGYGFHAVIIDERIEGRAPGLIEVREELQRDWMSRQRRESVNNLYDRLAQNYTIEIEPLADADAQGQP